MKGQAQFNNEHLNKENVPSALVNYLVNDNKDLVAIFSTSGTLKFISQSVEPLLGYSIKEILNMDYHNLIHPSDLPVIEEEIEEIKESTTITNTKIRLRHKDQTWRRMEVTGINLWHMEGFDGIFVHLRNNSYQLLYEVDDGSKAFLFQKLIDQSNDIHCILTDQGTILFANKACIKVLGYAPYELLGKSFRHFIIKKDWKYFQDAFSQLMSGLDLKGIENEFLNKDGSTITLQWSATYDSEEKKVFCILRKLQKEDYSNQLLKKRERRFRTLIQNSTDGLALLDTQGSILDTSVPAKKILAIRKKSDHPKLKEQIHKEDVHLFNEALFDVINDPSNIKKTEFRYLMPDGSWKWIEGIFQNQIKEPTINAIVLNFADITDRKQAERAIVKSESLRKKIMNSALDAIISIDMNGAVLIWNNQAEKIFGWKREEILGHSMVDLIIPEKYRVGHNLGMKRYLETGQGPMLNKRFEISALNREEKEFPIEMNIVPLEQDNATIFCAFIRDITERKEAENLLQESEDRYHKMVEEVTDYAILLLDENGIIQNWNKGAENIKGYKEEEIVGKSFELFYPPEKRDQKLHWKFLEEAAEKGEAKNEGYRIKKDGSLFWATVTLTALHNADGDIIGFTKVTRDLTAKKKAEKELLKYMKDLESSNEELEQFAYIASHDLQEPLRMITSFLTQLERKYKGQLDQKAQQYIHFATDGAARMRRIILDLLEYSRVGRKDHELEEINMNEIVNEVILFHRIEIRDTKANIIFEDLPVIYAARTPIEQVLQNLLTNAIKYHPPGVNPQVEIKSSQTNKFWKFSVSDNGIGIAPEFFEKIFILFQRLHRREEYSGTGIGLAICKKIIENSGGKIWVVSEPGKGSTFHFTIPKPITKH